MSAHEDVRVGDIAFSQSTILSHFRDGSYVLDLRDQLKKCRNDANKIYHVLHNHELNVVKTKSMGLVSMDNRRLWALKDAVSPDVFISVIVYDSPKAYGLKEFHQKMSTRNNGLAADMITKHHGFKSKEVIRVDYNIGMLIGKGGSNLRSLEERYGIALKLDSNSGFCEVSGNDSDHVKEIAIMLQRKHSDPWQVDMRVCITHPIELTRPISADSTQVFKVDKPGIVIGKGGTTLKGLQRKYLVDISFHRELEEDGEDDMENEVDYCTVSGACKDVLRARAEIEQLGCRRKVSSASRQQEIEWAFDVYLWIDQDEGACIISGWYEESVLQALEHIKYFALEVDYYIDLEGMAKLPQCWFRMNKENLTKGTGAKIESCRQLATEPNAANVVDSDEETQCALARGVDESLHLEVFSVWTRVFVRGLRSVEGTLRSRLTQLLEDFATNVSALRTSRPDLLRDHRLGIRKGETARETIEKKYSVSIYTTPDSLECAIDIDESTHEVALPSSFINILVESKDIMRRESAVKAIQLHFLPQTCRVENVYLVQQKTPEQFQKFCDDFLIPHARIENENVRLHIADESSVVIHGFGWMVKHVVRKLDAWKLEYRSEEILLDKDSTYFKKLVGKFEKFKKNAIEECCGLNKERCCINVELQEDVPSKARLLVEGYGPVVSKIRQYVDGKLSKNITVCPSETNSLGSLVTHTTVSEELSCNESDIELTLSNPLREPHLLARSAPAGMSPQCLLPGSVVCLSSGSWCLASDLEVGMELLSLGNVQTPVKIKAIQKEAVRLQDLVVVVFEHLGQKSVTLTSSHRVIVQCDSLEVIKTVAEVQPNCDKIPVIDPALCCMPCSDAVIQASIIEVRRFTENTKVVEIGLEADDGSFLVLSNPGEPSSTCIVVLGATQAKGYDLIVPRSGETLRAACQELMRVSSKSEPARIQSEQANPAFVRYVRPPHDDTCDNACPYHLKGLCRNGLTCRACHHPDHQLVQNLTQTRRGGKKSKKKNGAQADTSRLALGSPNMECSPHAK